jgi:hypothetical protein
MLKRPALEQPAAQESAPFPRDLMAAFISSSLAPQIVQQASAAKRAGREVVAPTVTGDPEVLRKAADYVSRRGGLAQRGRGPRSHGDRPTRPWPMISSTCWRTASSEIPRDSSALAATPTLASHRSAAGVSHIRRIATVRPLRSYRFPLLPPLPTAARSPRLPPGSLFSFDRRWSIFLRPLSCFCFATRTPNLRRAEP